MKSNKKAVFLTVSLIIVQLMSACGTEEAVLPAETLSAENSEENTVTEIETQEVYHDSLPELDFGGREFRVVSSVDWAGRIDTYHASLLYENTGEVLDDALYQRNLTVSERFNIVISETDATPTEAKNLVQKTVRADEDSYDTISLISQHALTMAIDGMLLPMDTIPYIALNEPWWNRTINDAMNICGHAMFAVSDMALTGYDYTHILLFNKTLAASLDIGDLYDAVERGIWTYDLFRQYALLASDDVNGDGKRDENDSYGWLAPPKQSAPSVWISGGALSISKDSNGNLVYSMDSERMQTLLALAYDSTWGDVFWYRNTINGMDIKDPPIFSAGRALFSTVTFQQLFEPYYRSLTFDYGILPYPKLNVEQGKYYSRVESVSPYCVPVTVRDTEFPGIMLEAFACESTNTVIPAYYEIALKTKFTRDTPSARVLDLVMENRIFDLGDTVFCDLVRDGFVFKNMNAGKPIELSDIEKSRKQVENEIKKLTAAVIEKTQND